MNIQKVTYSAVLGVVLTNLRKQKAIEQGAMAQLMGLSQASYSRLESGKSAFNIDQMYQAAKALNVDSTKIIELVNIYCEKLEGEGVKVESLVRGNSTQATQSEAENNDGAGKVLAGAALGAIVMALLSNR